MSRENYGHAKVLMSRSVGVVGYLFLFLGGVAGETHVEFFENLVINFAEHYGGVHLTPAELGEFFESATAILVVSGED